MTAPALMVVAASGAVRASRLVRVRVRARVRVRVRDRVKAEWLGLESSAAPG